MNANRRVQVEAGQGCGVVVDDDVVASLQPLHLVDHEVATLVVEVVGNHDTLWRECTRPGLKVVNWAPAAAVGDPVQ